MTDELDHLDARDPVAHLLADYDAIDLSQTLEEGMPSFPTHSRYYHELWESYWHGDVAVAYQVIMNEHSGTHVDAPAHFIRDGHPAHVWIDEMPVTALLGRAATIDVTDVAPRALFGPEVLDRFEAEHGPIHPGDIVLFRTGWSEKWKVRPDSGPYVRDWPGLNRTLAEELRARRVAAVGSDSMSPDRDGTEDYPVHYVLLPERAMILENLTNLDRLPAFSLFVALPLKIKGGSGSPVRAVAFVPKSGSPNPRNGRQI